MSTIEKKAQPTRRKELTKKQVEILAPLWTMKKEAESQWLAAMALLDVDPEDILGGDLNEGYLILKPDAVP